jgi:hypothetical protein
MAEARLPPLSIEAFARPATRRIEGEDPNLPRVAGRTSALFAETLGELLYIRKN